MNFLEKIQLLFSSNNKGDFYWFIYKTTGCKPVKIETYSLAFKHKSLHKIKNYERLEFLGDSVLDVIVTELLYQKFPQKMEGELSKIRSKLVSRNILNELALKLHLDKYYQYDKKLNIETFENLAGNVLEALIGAVYVDKGFNRTKQFVLQKIINPLVNWDEILNIADYKSLLLSKSQQDNFDLEYRVLNENPQDYKYRFSIGLFINGEKKTEATGNTIKNAEQKASELYFNK